MSDDQQHNKTFANVFSYWVVKDKNVNRQNNNNNNNNNVRPIIIPKKLNQNNNVNQSQIQQQPQQPQQQPVPLEQPQQPQQEKPQQPQQQQQQPKNNVTFINNSYQTNLRGYQASSASDEKVDESEDQPVSAYSIMPMSSGSESERESNRNLFRRGVAGLNISSSDSSNSAYANVDGADRPINSSGYTVVTDTENSYNSSTYSSYSPIHSTGSIYTPLSSYSAGGASTYSTFYNLSSPNINSNNNNNNNNINYSNGSNYSNDSMEFDKPIGDSTDDDNDAYDNNNRNDNRTERERSLLQSREVKDVGRDWNREFQNLLRMQPTLDKFQKLTFMAMDFVKAAETYGRIIIKEMFMPVKSKTIPPIDIGGVAGGEKYICQNILFKFAYDQKIGGSWLYGGKVPSDFGASKAAGNELRGLSFFFQNIMDHDCADRINVPLMCIIDYYGYRLVAISLLPITKKTLIYGSCDGGNTVHDDVPEVNEIMERVSKGMNLSGHLSGINPKFIYGPGDFEIHQSANNEFYALDFARLLPPQAYFDDSGNAIAHRDVFYRLLRPEFLRTWEKPLNSDAFTGWSSCDPDQEQHNQDVADATKHLFDVVIRQAALELEARTEDEESFDVAVEVHKLGINLRHLGRLRSQIDSHKKQIRKHILNEMIVRVLKGEIKDELRIKLRGHFIGSEEKCIDTIVSFLNHVFNVNRFNNEKEFWTITIKSLLLDKYGSNCGLTPDELDTKYDLSNSISITEVMSRFQAKTGIKLSSRIKTILEKYSSNSNVNSLPMVLYTDVKSVRPIIKHSNLIARSEGISLYMKALEFIYANTVYYGKEPKEPDFTRFSKIFAEEHSLLDSCRQKLELASRSSTTDASLHHLLGLVDVEKVKLNWNSSANDLHGNNHLMLKRAEKTLIASLGYHDSPGPIITLATVHNMRSDHVKAHATYQRLKAFEPQLFVPSLYESASLYAPYFTTPKHLSYLAISAHQLFILVGILESLPADHQLVKQYLHSSYKILCVILLRSISLKNCEVARILEALHDILHPSAEKAAEYSFSLAKTFGPFMERVLKYDPAIFDDILLASTKLNYGSVHFNSFVRYIDHVPSLEPIIVRSLTSHPLSSISYDYLESLFTDADALESLLKLKCQLDLLVYRKTNPNFVNLLQYQNNLTTMVITNIYLQDDEAFLGMFRCIKPTLTTFKMSSVRYTQPNPVVPDELIISCPNLKEVSLRDIEFETPSFQSLFKIIAPVVENLILERVPMDEMPEVFQSMNKLKHLELYSVHYVDVKQLPSSITSFGCHSDFNSHPEGEPFVEPFMKQCPNITDLQIQNYGHKFYDELAILKKYPFKRLRLGLNNAILSEQNMQEGLDVWGNSIEDLYLNINSYGTFEFIGQTISSLSLLRKLDLGCYKFDDGHLTMVIDKLQLLEAFRFDANAIQLTPQPKPHPTLSKVKMSGLRAPTNNYINLGLIFPQLKALEISNPVNVNDTCFRKLLENVKSLESLRLESCFDITDASIIALCSSDNIYTLINLSIVTSLNISDSSYVKLAETCTKLRSLDKVGSPFHRFTTEQYFGARYTKLSESTYDQVKSWPREPSLSTFHFLLSQKINLSNEQ
ncbi:hypothetical protein PPL_05504 [Heterostelium album PN500]|uniref:Clu domain-containing protein n=1 Tax=Heterostelium pallidum (strain ATCC 26659 / Pp 5 / PN500) TaxID=670386 RepID=D3BAC8_HETP5|nr:hypothetical protein PPL_05504 [Heterostelium album PN500]EFA81515.1 hypothetical protein PPL_05504 [Heterostelium album PN500]|eukprot:XP_020433632.1 hypothetical protein PPL_05504 [Heterostelium album PN500]